MKPRKTILFILIAALLCTLAAGCGKGAPEAPGADPRADVTLLTFETDADYSQIRIRDGFGRVSLNTDPQFVKSGLRSVRLDPTGLAYAPTVPTVYFPTLSERFGYDHSDFSYVDSVRFALYNAQGDERTVRVGLVGTATLGFGDTFHEEAFTLAPGWNTVQMYIDSMIVSMMGDIEHIGGIYFSFDSAHAADVSDATPRYYLDDLELLKKAQKFEGSFDYALKEGEIADFEQYYQSIMFFNEPGLNLSIVRAEDYGIAATSGKSVLRAAFTGGGTNAWLRFGFRSPLITAGALGGLTAAGIDNAYLCYDGYCNNLGLSTADNNTNMVIMFSFNGSSYVYSNIPGPLIPGKWTTFSISLKTIHSFGGIQNLKSVAFDYKDIAVDRELFFDNFRVEYR
ncbi:MAG: hypothetical protein LBM78_01095 [Clostridiales bacterium]|jgi:hypothetical protein|nr:hypothetical protein [Clostridiales bacterium]